MVLAKYYIRECAFGKVAPATNKKWAVQDVASLLSAAQNDPKGNLFPQYPVSSTTAPHISLILVIAVM